MEALRRRVAGIVLINEILSLHYSLSSETKTGPIFSCLMDCLKYPRKEIESLASKGLGRLLATTTESLTSLSNDEDYLKMSSAIEVRLQSKMLQKDGYDSCASWYYFISS